MTDRELMQMALDALELMNGSERADGIIVYADEEIKALRDRLAQPETIPIPETTIPITNGGVATLTPASEFFSGQPKPKQPCPTCEALARTVMMDQASHDTAPPKPSPLTEEQIEQCCYEADATANDHTDTWRWTTVFARAIEAAHGIKEKDNE